VPCRAKEYALSLLWMAPGRGTAEPAAKRRRPMPDRNHGNVAP